MGCTLRTVKSDEEKKQQQQRRSLLGGFGKREKESRKCQFGVFTVENQRENNEYEKNELTKRKKKKFDLALSCNSCCDLITISLPAGDLESAI